MMERYRQSVGHTQANYLGKYKFSFTIYLYYCNLAQLIKNSKAKRITIDRGFGSNFAKPRSVYFNEIVQCGGKKGDSVKIEQTGAEKSLYVYEMKVYRTALLAIGKSYIHY